jgi:single-strand DNA-binding protein|uniref:Single-stranded DNA-binding protein n=1 Tax=candidate division WOR-3 bacterium TaxID=2052148 RepID=A0A7C3URN1_UNCW3
MAEIRLGSLNYVVLIGRATQEPELRFTPKGTPVLEFRIAVNERVKDKETEEWKDYTSYFDVRTFGPVAERCNERMKKGSAVIVEGRLRSRDWTDNQGQKRSKIEIVARRVQILDKVAPAGTVEPTEEIEIPEENIDDLPF